MRTLLSIALVGASLAASSAYAGDAGFIVGLKAGNMKIKADDIKNESATATGLVVGYGFSNGMAIEVEANKADGDLEYTDPWTLTTEVDSYKVDTRALYLAYRTPGNAYFKVKAGALHHSTTIDYSWGSETTNGNNFSAGLGGGYDFGPVMLEVEYTALARDTKVLHADADLISVSLSANF